MLHGKHNVFSTITGLQRLYQTEKLKPALILLDITLPDSDAYEIQQHLRADSRFEDIPIIAITANSMLGERERILSMGFDDYLAKPVTCDELTTTVERFFVEALV